MLPSLPRLPLLAATLLTLLTRPTLAAFGLTQSGSNYIIDTGAGLVFQVNRNTGDINSLLYNNIQVQDSAKFSHINSGLGSSDVQGSVVGNEFVRVVVRQGEVTQFYVAKSGDPIIYMATHITAEPSVGELRFIARLKKSAVPNGHPSAEIEGGTAIEGSDIFRVANGDTRGKFYSSKPFIDDQVHCVSGSNVGVCMVVPDTSYESSSGGPFFRDIDNQGGVQQELYFYMNSGHVQTEAYRMGLHGPYAMVFTSGSEASPNLDFSFFSQLSITGFVPKDQRGYVSGSVSSMPTTTTSTDTVLHWYNDAAQYWARANISNGEATYVSPAMKPGSYTMRLYHGELSVQTLPGITVTAGQTTSNIAITPAQPTPPNPIFRIGAADGTPRGFRHAEKQLLMHPSDTRISASGGWPKPTFLVGTTPVSDFPMAQIKALNEPTTIVFSATQEQASSPGGGHTLRIYTTLAFAGARPSVTVNGFAPPVPPAPRKIDSRGFTRGAYRGWGEVYDFVVPIGTVRAGAENRIEIWVASGSSGDGFLAPNFIFDAVELF